MIRVIHIVRSVPHRSRQQDSTGALRDKLTQGFPTSLVKFRREEVLLIPVAVRFLCQQTGYRQTD